jgi:two-component system cell cycle response regulator DivK
VTSRPISAALMDVSLKNTRVKAIKVDGVELTRRIRSLPGGVGLPVILLTAHAMKGDRERLLFSSGANDYVAKPIADQHALVSLVRRHIEMVQDFEDEQDPS